MRPYVCTLIYLGPVVPRYVVLNCLYLMKTFPSLNLMFISDNDSSLRIMNSHGIPTKQVPTKDFLWPELISSSKLPVNFRNGFWQYTILRFKAIEYLMNEINMPILQIESDVWLSPRFPFEKVTSLNKLSYSMTTKDHGSPSIMWFPNLKETRKLNRFVLKTLNSNPYLSDMQILGRFATRKNSICVLPSSIAKDVDSTNQYLNLDKHSIFDPGTYGMYLLGEDSRNRKGIRIFNHAPELHLVNPSEYSYIYNDGKLILEKDGIQKELQCIHVHSKDSRIFKNSNKQLELRMGQIRTKSWRRLEFRIFISQAYKAVKRRCMS